MVRLSGSLDGTTPNMKLVLLDDGSKGILKEVDVKKSLLMENQYQAVAEFFGLPVSHCVPYGDAFVSIISYNERYEQVSSYELCQTNTLIAYKEVLPESVYVRVLLIAFVDAVTKSGDRHSGNISFLKSTNGNIVDLCPVYGNVVCLSYSFTEEALLCPDESKVWKHIDVFKWLQDNMPNFDLLLNLYSSGDFTKTVSSMCDGELLLERRAMLIVSLNN